MTRRKESSRGKKSVGDKGEKRGKKVKFKKRRDGVEKGVDVWTWRERA